MECYNSVSIEPGCVDSQRLTGIVYENISDADEMVTKPMIKIEETESSSSGVVLNSRTEEATTLDLPHLNTNMAAPATFHNLANVPVHISKKESDWDLSDTNSEKTLEICQNVLPNMFDVDSANKCSLSLQNVCLTQSPSSSLSEEVTSPAIKLYRENRNSLHKKHRRKSKTHVRVTPKKSKKKRFQEPFVFEFANDEDTYSLESEYVLDETNSVKTREPNIDVVDNIIERNFNVLGAQSTSLGTFSESSKCQSTLPFEIAPSRKRGRPRKKPIPTPEPSSTSEDCEDACTKINEQEQQQIIGFCIADTESSETAGAVIVNSPPVYNSTVPPKKRKMEIKSALKQIKVEKDISFSGDEESLSSSPTKSLCARGRPKKSKKKKISPRKRLAHRIGRPPVIGNFKCDRCDLVFQERPKLIQHRKKHVRPFIYCSYCDFRARSKESFMEHESKHTKTKPFKCELCPYASRSRIDLQRHQAKHSKVKNYKCPYCDFTTKWRRNVSSHLLSHVDHRPFCCEICGQSFKRSCDLKYHLYRHTSEKPLQCEECEFRCKTKYELNLHKFKHSDVRSFPCTHPGCKQACKTKSDLAKHMHVHSEERNHPCPLCGKYFKSPSARNKHAQRHTDERPFKCNICNKGFKVKSSLGKHRQLHSGIRPFSCDVCDRTFSNKSNKEVHMRTHDTTNRPYRCPLCPYGGKSQQNLLAHVGTMHGNYAFFCELCKRPYKRHSQLQLHYKRMHTKKELEKLNSLDSLDMTLIKGEEEDAQVTSQDEGISEDQSGINHILKQIKQESSMDEESITSASCIDVEGLKTEFASTVKEQNQHFTKKKRRGRPRKNLNSCKMSIQHNNKDEGNTGECGDREPPKEKNRQPKPQHLSEKHIRDISDPSHNGQKRNNSQKESRNPEDNSQSEESIVSKEISTCITVDKPSTVEEQAQPCPMKKRRGRPRKKVETNLSSCKKSSNRQNVDCGSTDKSEHGELQTRENGRGRREQQSDRYIRGINDTNCNELKINEKQQRRQKGHSTDKSQSGPSADCKPLVNESQIGHSLDDSQGENSTDNQLEFPFIHNSERVPEKDIRKSDQSADNNEIEQSVVDRQIAQSADNIQSELSTDNRKSIYSVNNSRSEHPVDNSPSEHLIDNLVNSQSGHSTEDNQSEHSPDNNQREQSVDKSQSKTSVGKSLREHSVYITQCGQSAGNIEGEHSRDKNRSEHSTVISQSEQQTVISQSEQQTVISQSEQQTVISQSEQQTVINQSEQQTVISQSEQQTVISQSEQQTVISQSEQSIDNNQTFHSNLNSKDSVAKVIKSEHSTEESLNASISSTLNGQCVISNLNGHLEDHGIGGHGPRGRSSVKKRNSRNSQDINSSSCEHILEEYTVDNRPEEHSANYTKILLDEDNTQMSHQEMDIVMHCIQAKTHDNVIDKQSSSSYISWNEKPTVEENNMMLYDLYPANGTVSHTNRNAKKSNDERDSEEIHLKTATVENVNLVRELDGSERLPGAIVESGYNTCKREEKSNKYQANGTRDDSVNVNSKDTSTLSNSTEHKDQDRLEKFAEEEDQVDNPDLIAEKHGDKQNFSVENGKDTIAESCTLSRNGNNASNTGPSDSSEIGHVEESCGKVDESCEIGNQSTMDKPSGFQKPFFGQEEMLTKKKQTCINDANSNSTWTKFDDNFRLPLATKGFHFNFRKTGKKPKCWFMDLDAMDEESKNRQLQYLRRKARMVSIGQIPGKKRKTQLSGQRKKHKLTSEDLIKGNKNTYRSFRNHRKESITKNPVAEQGCAHRHYTSRLDGMKVSKEDLFKLNKSEGTMLKPKLSIVSNEVSESCMQKVKGISLTSRRLPFKKKYIKLEVDSEGRCVKPEENYPIEDGTDTSVPVERTVGPKKSVPKNGTNQENELKNLKANHTEANKNVFSEEEGSHQINKEPSNTVEQVLEMNANKLSGREKQNSIKRKAVCKTKAMGKSRMKLAINRKEFDDSVVKRGRGRPTTTGVKMKTGRSVKLKLQEKIKQRQVEPKSKTAAVCLTTDGEIMNNSGYDGTQTKKRKQVVVNRKSRQCLVCMRDMLYGKDNVDDYPENLTCPSCELDKCSSAEFEANRSKNIYEKIDLGSDSDESEDGELFSKNVYVVKPPVDKAVVQTTVQRISGCNKRTYVTSTIGNVETYVVSKEMNKDAFYELTDVRKNVVNNVSNIVTETLSEGHGESQNQLFQSGPATWNDSNTNVIKIICCQGSFDSGEPVDIKPNLESLDFQVQMNNHDTSKSVDVVEGVDSKVVFHQYPLHVTSTCVSDSHIETSSEQTIKNSEENGNLHYSYISAGTLEEANSNNNCMRTLDSHVCLATVNANVSKEDMCVGSEQQPTDTKLYVYCDDVAAMRSGTGHENHDENTKVLWNDPCVKTVVEDLGNEARLINGQTENVTVENYLGCKVKVEKGDLNNEIPDLVDSPAVIQSSYNYNDKTYAKAGVTTDIKPLPVYHLSESNVKYCAEQDQGLEPNLMSDSASIPGQDTSSCLPVILDVRSIKEEPDFDGV